MAFELQPELTVGLIDNLNRNSSYTVRITAAAAQAYAAAVDATARAATTIGVLIAAVDALTNCTVTTRGIVYVERDNAAVAASTGVYRGNKFVTGFSGSGRNFVTSLAGRNEEVVNLNGLDVVIIGGSLATTNYVAAFNAVALDINGAAATLQYIRAND